MQETLLTRQPKKQLSEAPYQLIYPTSKRVDETWLRTAYADMVTTRWSNEDPAHWDDADAKRYWTEAKTEGTIEQVHRGSGERR